MEYTSQEASFFAVVTNHMCIIRVVCCTAPNHAVPEKPHENIAFLPGSLGTLTTTWTHDYYVYSMSIILGKWQPATPTANEQK